MVLGVCTVEVYIPGANSLKNKRGVIKSIIQRLRNKFNVSICELEQQDRWRYATLGIAVIGTDQKMISKVLSGVEKFLDNNGEFQVTNLSTEIF